jgi:hypothetical protein
MRKRTINDDHHNPFDPERMLMMTMIVADDPLHDVVVPVMRWKRTRSIGHPEGIETRYGRRMSEVDQDHHWIGTTGMMFRLLHQGGIAAPTETMIVKLTRISDKGTNLQVEVGLVDDDRSPLYTPKLL